MASDRARGLRCIPKAGVLFSVLLATAALSFAPGARAATQARTETKPYLGPGDALLTPPSDRPLGYCEGTAVAVGGNCFELRASDRSAVFLIRDENMAAPIGGGYQFVDRSGKTYAIRFFCESSGLVRIPPGATEVMVHTGILIGGMGGCLAPSVPTKGTVTATLYS